ncbi:MAG: hypothetical protein GKR88_04855 [Flavobacteriaceae bacterium]|nr:MAG: hypothetical protein GKR88_04855 [Flavobacteriaceae bacterium]
MVYFAITFVLKSIITAKKINKNPFVLTERGDGIHGLIGNYFKIIMAGLFIYALLFSLVPAFHDYFLPIPFLKFRILKIIGIFFSIISFMWIVIAQYTMKNSWRTGIDNYEAFAK